jgi:hypothetical protein
VHTWYWLTLHGGLNRRQKHEAFLEQDHAIQMHMLVDEKEFSLVGLLSCICTNIHPSLHTTIVDGQERGMGMALYKYTM